jgi:hypothetical protein
MIGLSEHDGTSCVDDAGQKQRHAGGRGSQPEEPKPQARQADLISVVSVLGRGAHLRRVAAVWHVRGDETLKVHCVASGTASSAAFSHASEPCSVMQTEDIGLGARLANEESPQLERVSK